MIFMYMYVSALKIVSKLKIVYLMRGAQFYNVPLIHCKFRIFFIVILMRTEKNTLVLIL